MEQRRADVDAPLHPARKLADVILLPVREADDLEHFIDAGFERRAAQAIHLAPKDQVLTRRQVGVERNLLRHHAQAGLGRFRRAADGMAHNRRVTVARGQQPRKHRDGRRFARAVRPQQAQDFALLSRKLDPGHGLELAKGFLEILDFDCVHKFSNFCIEFLSLCAPSRNSGNSR